MDKSSSNQSWQELGQLTCERCGLKTSDTGLFQAHHCRIRLPTNTSPQITAAISYSFRTGQYTCSLCKVNLLENEFREHLECHFSVSSYTCKYCSSRFETVVEAFEHLKKSHSEDVQEVNLLISNHTKELMQKAKNHGKVFYKPVNVNVINKVMSSRLSPTSSVPSQQVYIVRPSASTYSKASPASTAEHGKQMLTVFTGQRDAQEKKQLPWSVKQYLKDPKSSYFSRPLATVAPLTQTPAATPSSLSSNIAPVMAQNFTSQITAPPRVTRAQVSGIFHQFSTVSPLTSFRPPYLHCHNYSNFSSTLPAQSELSTDMENHETNKTSECLGLQITNVISLSSSSVSEVEQEDHTTETPLLHQNSSGVRADEEKEVKERVNFNYLQDVKDYLLCLKCKLKWYKDYDLFLHHVWKKHAHDGDFSCCPKGYSLKCSSLRAVVEDIYSRSQEPESKQILNYLKSQPCSGNKAPSPQLSNNLTSIGEKDTSSINTIVPVTSNEEILLNNSSTLHEQFQSQEICHEPYQTLNNSTISNTSHLINQIMQELNRNTLNDTVRPHILQELNVQKQLQMNTEKTSEDIASNNSIASRKDVNSSSIIKEISWPINRPLDLSQKMPRVRKRTPVNKSVSRRESQDFPISDSLPSDKYNVLKSFLQCGFCKCHYNSPKSVDLCKHMEESHSLDSEYTCSYCMYKCLGGVDFLQHLKGHIDNQRVKTYSCSLLKNSCTIAQFENENSNFIMRMLETSLEAYNSNSDTEFQFACNICSTAFESVHDLMAHLNKFLLKIVTCKYCESYFLDTNLWQKHMASDHVKMSRMYHINKKLLCHDYNLNRTINSQVKSVRNVPVLDNINNKNIMNSVMERTSEHLMNLVTARSSVQNECSRLSGIDETEPSCDPAISVECVSENDRNQTGVVSCLVDNGFSNEIESPVQNSDGSEVSDTTADCSCVDSPIQETKSVTVVDENMFQSGEPKLLIDATLDMPALRGSHEKIPREMDVPNVSESAAPGISEVAIEGFLPPRLQEVSDENLQDKPSHQLPDNPDSVKQDMAETTTQDMSEPVAKKCDMTNVTSPRLHKKTVTSEPEALPVFGQSDVSESVTQDESEFAIQDVEPGCEALQAPGKTGTQDMSQSVAPECITHNVPLSKPQKIPETIIQDVAYSEIESAIQDVMETVPQNGDHSVAQDVGATSSQPVSPHEADVTESEIVSHHVPQVRAQDMPILISKEAFFNGTKSVPISQTEMPIPRGDIDKHNLKIKSTILSLANATQPLGSSLHAEEYSCNNDEPEIATTDATLIRDNTVRLRCYICDYWSIDQEDFLNHVISKKHSIFNSHLFAFKQFHIVKCIKCDYVANGSPDLISHIISEHIPRNEPLTKKGSEFCDILPSVQRLQSMEDISVEKETATVPNQSLSDSNSQKISVPPVSSTHCGELIVSVENEECTATRLQAFSTSKSGQNVTLRQSKTFLPNSSCTYKGNQKEYLNKENRKINNEILTSDKNTDVHVVASSGDIEAHEKVADTGSHCMKSSNTAGLAARIVARNRVVEQQQALNPVLTEKKLTGEIQLPANTKEDRSALPEGGATQKSGKRQKTKLQALHMKTALEVAKKHKRVEQTVIQCSDSPDIVPAVHKQTAVLNDSASPVTSGSNRLDKTNCQTEVDKSLSANGMALKKTNDSDTHRSTECGPAEHHSEKNKNMKSDGYAVMKSSPDCDKIISHRCDALLTRNAMDSHKSTNQALKPTGSHEGKPRKLMLDNSACTAFCEKAIGLLTSNTVDSHKVLKSFKRKQEEALDKEAKKVKLDNSVHTTVCEKANKLLTSNSMDSHKASSPALKPIKSKLQESHEGETKKTKLDNSVVHTQHKPSVLVTSDSNLSPRFKCSVCTSWTSYSYTKIKQHLEVHHVGNKLAKLLRIPSQSQKTVSSGNVIKNQKHGLYPCIHKNCDDWKDDIMREHINSKHPLDHCNGAYHFLNKLQNHQKFVHRGKEPYIITGNIPLEKLSISTSENRDDARERGKTFSVKESNGKKVSGSNKKSVYTDSPANLATVAINQAEGEVPKVEITEKEPHSSANWITDDAGISSKMLHEDSQISLKEHKLTVDHGQKNRVTCDRIMHVDKGETVLMNLTEVSREDISVGMKPNNTSEDKSIQNTSFTSQNSGPSHDHTAAPRSSMKHDKIENQPRPVNGETSVSKHAVTEQGQRTKCDHQQIESAIKSNIGQQTFKKNMTLEIYPFRCTICKTRPCFKTLCKAEEHFKWLHTEKEIQLIDRKTKSVFTTTGMLTEPHMKLPARPHLCKYCPFRSKMRSDVEVHVKTKHPLKEMAVITLHPPDQHLATGSTEPSHYLANDSIELQVAEGENHDNSTASRSAILTPSCYCCHLCNDFSSTEFLFRLHLAKHPGFKHTTTLTTVYGLLVCPTCGYIAKSKGDLAQHTGQHFRERRFMCSLCNTDSHVKKSLESHIKNTHPEEEHATVLDRKVLHSVNLKPKLVNLDPKVLLIDPFKQHPNYLQKLGLKEGINVFDFPADICSNILALNNDEFFNTFYL